MSALNKKETEYLTHAEQVLTTVGTFLKEIEDNPEESVHFSEKQLAWLQREVKKAFGGIRAVKTIKGYYPS